MAQTLPPPDSRSRGSSNASMNRYTPDYQTPPPPPPAPGGGAAQIYTTQTRPRGPSLENHQIPSVPPYPLSNDPTLNNHMQLQRQQPQQQQQQQPAYAGAYQTPPYPTIGENNALRPPLEQRRQSASSTHSGSRRSHDSHRSSHRRSSSSHPRSSSADHRERRSHDRYDDDDRHSHHSHHYSHHDKADDHKPVTRVSSHRPTFGDSIFAIFDYFKNSFK